MTPVLLAGVAGLALLDSLNPATILSITLILLAGLRRPVVSALAFVLGAFATVFTLGLAIFLSAGAAADVVSGGVVWLRRIAFGVAAVALLVAAFRRLRDRPREGVTLPRWFSPVTALPLGVMMTGADLPNAFPYFIAIERMINAEVPAATGALVLAGYALVYCLPCLVLLVLGILFRERVRLRLQVLVDRFSTGTVRRSAGAAVLLALAALGVASVAAWP
ncbi:GAP family protein [Cryobacterium fucosi]|uniref:GAP family protein n=1 Tax=Cryobacterium fucosi TaxID=1259157 RepID=UPI00141A90B8|nr:GAP family protein [Cryobacterium fucosi]